MYAPIRKKYVEEKRHDNKCPFCNYKNKQEYIIYEGNTAAILANNYPYFFGHLLVIPKRHIKNLEDLNKDEDKDVMLMIKRAVKFLKVAFNPEGFNIGLGIGNYSGGSQEHLHFHVVPHYKGDIGFMNLLDNVSVQANKPEEMVVKLKKKNGLR